uniref:hypothetical protein n=1 Tax=Yersinia massiliensis TaxID=419257 RepID=UPI003704CF88
MGDRLNPTRSKLDADVSRHSELIRGHGLYLRFSVVSTGNTFEKAPFNGSDC